MKTSKKLIQHLHYILLLCVFFSCSSGVRESNDVEKPRRVKILENGHYDIIDVDGCQYISNDYHGGVTHLETCPNTH